MTDQLSQLLDQIDRLDQEASQGPWDATTSEATMNDRSLWRIGQTSKPQVSKSVMRTADAEFIALARTALPQLAKALQAVMDCVIDMEKDIGDESPYDAGISHMAGTVRHIVTDAMNGADDD